MEKQTGSGRSFSGHMGQKFGQSFGQKVVKRLGKDIAHRSEALGQRLDQQVDQIADRVQSVAQTASATAKSSLDQILLNLEHRGLNFKEKQELINRVSQTVLERAERIRSQISEHPSLANYAPAWMKEPFVKSDVPAEAAGSMTEATVSEPAQAMQTDTLATELAADVAVEAGEQTELAVDALTDVEEAQTASEAKPRKKSKSTKAKTSKSK